MFYGFKTHRDHFAIDFDATQNALVQSMTSAFQIRSTSRSYQFTS